MVITLQYFNMKKLLLLIIPLILLGCGSPKERAERVANNYFVITIDSCEYIIAKAPLGDYGWLLSHKGNCKNPIHYKK